MTGGEGLPGIAAPPARGRGRPKGSTNKRARDLKGFVDARYGASAAQQSAAICMVTPAELRAAGGSMAKAQVNKALDLVKHVRAAQEGRNEWLRQVVREELADLADELPDQVEKAVRAAMKRISEAAAGFGLREALDMLTRERGQLLPYTDQRQPLAIEASGPGLAPSVVVQLGVGAGQVMPSDLEFAEVFDVAAREVSQPKSHEDGHPPDLLQLSAPDAAD